MLASKPSMDSQSDRPRFGNPDSAKTRRALGRAAADTRALKASLVLAEAVGDKSGERVQGL
jgi:hypothetical protein